MKINNIRNKLGISLVGICMLPLIILGLVSYFQSKAILNQKLSTTSQQTLIEVNTGMDNYFSSFGNMVSMLSQNYNVINSDNDINVTFIPGVLKSVKDVNPDIFSAYFGTKDGKFNIYPNSKMPDDFNPTARPWYKQAMEHKGQVIVTLPFKDAQTGKSVVSIAKTVERNGEVIGVCAMNLSLETLSGKITEKKVGNSGYVFISDSDGNVIAHPNKDIINTNEASKLAVWNEIKTSDSGFTTYTYNGQKKFGAFDTNSMTGWKVVAILNDSELSNDTKAILITTITSIFIMLIISILVSLFLSKGIATNIKNLKKVFEKAENGDLTVSIEPVTKDEFLDLATSFNSMIRNISNLIQNAASSSNEVLETSTNLASMSEEVTASISDVAKAIEDVAHGATQQAQNAQNGVTEMNELSKKLDKISENSTQIDMLSNNTKTLGTKGLSIINTLIDKTNKTKTSTSEVNRIIQDMNESTIKISSISEAIAEITEQTSLLSLNASIESARAGEAGKGFAVVAAEIGKLAEESKNSTEEIKSIIENIQKKSTIAVQAIKATEDIVIEQDLEVANTQKIFDDILNSINTMINKIDEIKFSINDVSQKKENTMIEIENISSISEETASSSEEVTASTEEISSAMDRFTKYAETLKSLAEKLDNELDNFKVK